MAAGTDQQRQQVDRYSAALLRIEQAAVRIAIGHLLATLAMLRRQAAAAALLRPAALDAQITRLRRELQQQVLPVLADPAIAIAVERQAQAAVDLAARELADGLSIGPLGVDPASLTSLSAALATAGERVGAAVKLLDRADTPLELQAALKVADWSVVHVATGAEYAINDAANSAPRRIAVALGQQLVWVAERDACVVCAALSGHVIDPNAGEAFDEDATFDTRPPPPVWPPGMPLIGPPRHPHCRCIEQVWRGSVVPGQPSWPDRLRHEALRSVARGWSLPSESNAARLRAAHRILGTGAAGQLPKSVRAEAVRAVATGEFSNRNVPV